MDYISVFTDSFGLFQYFFRKLVFILPSFVMIFGFIYLFYFIFKK